MCITESYGHGHIIQVAESNFGRTREAASLTTFAFVSLLLIATEGFCDRYSFCIQLTVKAFSVPYCLSSDFYAHFDKQLHGQGY